MRYLIQVQEIYRVSSEKEAAELIEESKKQFTILKSSTEYKEVKQKGEVVEQYYKVTITKKFTDIKEPDCTVASSYTVDMNNYDNDIEEEE